MGFPTSRLGSFLDLRRDWIVVDDLQTYKRARVQLHGRGVVLRDRIDGAALKTKKQQIVRTGQFLVAEIDAKVGGFGIVPPEVDGAVVSSHYFVFDIDESACLTGWLDAYVQSGLLEDQVVARGSTNYAAIRPQQVLEFEIPLPSVPEQRRLIGQREQLVALKVLHDHAGTELDLLLRSLLYRAFRGEL